MLFDNILKEIGEFGWYQRRVYLLVAAPTLLVAFETLSVVFIFFIPDHRCAIPGYDSDTHEVQNDNHSFHLNLTIPMTDGQVDQCHVYSDVSLDNDSFNAYVTENASYSVNRTIRSKCESWVYDHSTFESTIATDFDVVCHRSIHRASSNLVSELGTLLGIFISGIISDRFGRKVPFYFGGVALIGGGFGIAFTQHLTTVNICRFLLGIARMAVFVNGLVIGMEIVGPSKRAQVGIVIEFFWCFGAYVLVLMAYLIRNWRYLEIAVSIPSVVLLFYWWLIPESPRWLATNGREAEALQILERIARSNKTKVPPVEDSTHLVEKEQEISVRTVLRCKQLLLRVIIVMSNMFVIVVVYYGLTLNITNLSGDIFVNFTISNTMETLAYALCLLLLDRLGRKPVYIVSLFLAGGVCTLSFLPAVLNMPSWIIVALCMAGRFAVCMAFGTILVFGPELFPTVVRSSATGVCVSFSRIGSLLAPFIADVGLLVGGRYKDALPLLLMGSPALVVGFFSLLLPETLNAALPDTLDDLKRSKIRRGCPCCPTAKRRDVEVTVTSENQTATDV